MNASEALKNAIVENLGYKTGTVAEVRSQVVNIIGCGEKNCIVTCVEEDKPYIEAMYELIGSEYVVKVIVKQKAGRVPRGTGFGDKVWRRNSKHNGIEVSFNGKPEDNIRENLKLLGFRWSHTSGVWYIGIKKFGEKAGEYLSGIGIQHVEDV